MKALQFKQNKVVVAVFADDDASRFNYQWLLLTPFSDFSELVNWIISDDIISPDFTISGFSDGIGNYASDHYNYATPNRLTITKREGNLYAATFYNESGNFLGREFFGADELPEVLTVFKSQTFSPTPNG